MTTAHPTVVDRVDSACVIREDPSFPDPLPNTVCRILTSANPFSNCQ